MIPHTRSSPSVSGSMGIEPVPVIAEPAQPMRREKFEACVVPLADWTGLESILEAVRNSRSNRRCAIYGVGGSAQDAMRLSAEKACLVVFEIPLS